MDRFESRKQMGGDWRRENKLPTGNFCEDVLKILDDLGGRIWILWCLSHEGVPRNERAHGLANAGTDMAEARLPQPSPSAPRPKRFVDFQSPSPRDSVLFSVCGPKHRRLEF